MSNHGYVPYRPTNYAKSVLAAAKHVLVTYNAGSSPMTVRQVFYRLVAEFNYAKTEKAYGSLIGFIARSRRAYQARVIDLMVEDGFDYWEARDEADGDATLIPFEFIRDEKGQSTASHFYEDGDDFLRSIKGAADVVRLNRQEGQPQKVELWCEAAGMVPLMSEIAAPYGFRVSSGGGYDSVTAKHRLAQRVADTWGELSVPTLVLHIGDFDPSGEGMYETLRDDVGEMVWQLTNDEPLEVRRIGLTEDQVISMGIETAPPKRQDSRRRAFVAKHPRIREHLGSDDITAQLEALTPPDLRELVNGVLSEVIDTDALDEVKAREAEVRSAVKAALEDVAL